jgi:hypothetical protein
LLFYRRTVLFLRLSGPLVSAIFTDFWRGQRQATKLQNVRSEGSAKVSIEEAPPGQLEIHGGLHFAIALLRPFVVILLAWPASFPGTLLA